ncbi:MAG: TolC family protein, partial [Acidobacteria bacterium]|nr:TolC family protein [Acidobacteriota bacterium]
KLEQAGKRPNPELESKVESTRAGDDHLLSFGVVQQWERGGKRELRQRLAEADLEQARLEAEDYFRILTFEVGRTYLELLQLQQQARVLDNHLERINGMVQLDQVRVREGEVASLNLAHLEIEFMRVSVSKTELESQAKLARYRFNTLIGADPGADQLLADEEPQPSPPPLPAMEKAISFALRNRPDLKRLRAAVEQAQSQVDMERAVGKRDWRVGLGYVRERTTLGGDDVLPRDLFRSITDTDHLVELKLTIPLPLLDNNSGNLSAAVEAKKAREAELAHLESVIRGDVAATYQQYERSRSLGEMLRKTFLPKLEDDLRREEAAYQLAGDVFGDWIRDQRNFSEGSLQSVETDFDLRRAVIELEKQVGGSLQQVAQAP